MNTEDATNPVAEEELAPASVEGVAEEANAQGDDQPEIDEDGNPIAGPDDETEEIEHDGVKYSVPKALKESFLRQADYTRKTQEVAELRRTAEAEVQQRRQAIEQQAQLHEATLTERVQLATLDTQLEQFNGFDWSAYEQQYGAGAVATAMATWRQLEAQRGQLAGSISEKEQSIRLSGEQAIANAIQEADRVLSQEVPGYGPDLVSKAWEAGKSFGFTPEEMRDSFVGPEGKADVRTFKLLAELATLRADKAAQTAKESKAKTVAKVAAVQPARSVSANAGQYKPGLSDDLPVDEWNRRRTAQLAKAGGR